MKQHFIQGLDYILGFLVVFFLEITAALFAVGFLIIVDTFTGIWAAYKRKEEINSRKLGRIMQKIVLYPLAIIIAKVAEDYLAPDIPWIYVTTGIIGAVEVKSNFENIGSILGFNLWKRIKAVIWKDKVDTLAEEDKEDVYER